MPRKPAHIALGIFLNGQPIEQLTRQADGAISFRYAPTWLERTNALPVSLSLPYDVLTAEPILAAHGIRRNKMKLAVAVGTKRHYRLKDIHGRHFVETARSANMSDAHQAGVRPLIRQAVDKVTERCEPAFATVADGLPAGFPEQILADIRSAARKGFESLATAHEEWRS